ncbi:gamma-glutamylcyclotransferase family protein [Nodosilinea sp. P-1105]|uniref:gamma-glutamylcyclotransferase family protein n=1 Tax=Nodosilinea sp. P-1105 TaxID=2546229 RepID=UPI00146BCC59|nr:gamma-glutamylcyclotransferase family protein [Nodosilinea sp. P-1105]NMF83614.1 gamma-glutamylcyclotransferase [Nodosilinea sp. P-1105]
MGQLADSSILHIRTNLYKACSTNPVYWQPAMTSPEFQLFVYGTLKPGEGAFEQFCQPFTPDRQLAMAPGRLYRLPLGYPAMTLEEGWVQGVLLTFGNAAILTTLDEFEEYYPDNPKASEYQRLRHGVYNLEQTFLTQAWVYTMSLDRVQALGGRWLPEGYWSQAVSKETPQENPP